MSRKYSVGDVVVINVNDKEVEAEVFAHINLDLGTKSAYSLRINNHYVFVKEEEIIGKRVA
jgi:hypothetical protein